MVNYLIWVMLFICGSCENKKSDATRSGKERAPIVEVSLSFEDIDGIHPILFGESKTLKEGKLSFTPPSEGGLYKLTIVEGNRSNKRYVDKKISIPFAEGKYSIRCHEILETEEKKVGELSIEVKKVEKGPELSSLILSKANGEEDVKYDIDEVEGGYLPIYMDQSEEFAFDFSKDFKGEILISLFNSKPQVIRGVEAKKKMAINFKENSKFKIFYVEPQSSLSDVEALAGLEKRGVKQLLFGNFIFNSSEDSSNEEDEYIYKVRSELWNTKVSSDGSEYSFFTDVEGQLYYFFKDINVFKYTQDPDTKERVKTSVESTLSLEEYINGIWKSVDFPIEGQTVFFEKLKANSMYRLGFNYPHNGIFKREADLLFFSSMSSPLGSVRQLFNLFSLKDPNTFAFTLSDGFRAFVSSDNKSFTRVEANQLVVGDLFRKLDIVYNAIENLFIKVESERFSYVYEVIFKKDSFAKLAPNVFIYDGQNIRKIENGDDLKGISFSNPQIFIEPEFSDQLIEYKLIRGGKANRYLAYTKGEAIRPFGGWKTGQYILAVAHGLGEKKLSNNKYSINISNNTSKLGLKSDKGLNSELYPLKVILKTKAHNLPTLTLRAISEPNRLTIKAYLTTMEFSYAFISIYEYLSLNVDGSSESQDKLDFTFAGNSFRSKNGEIKHILNPNDERLLVLLVKGEPDKFGSDILGLLIAVEDESDTLRIGNLIESKNSKGKNEFSPLDSLVIDQKLSRKWALELSESPKTLTLGISKYGPHWEVEKFAKNIEVQFHDRNNDKLEYKTSSNRFIVDKFMELLEGIFEGDKNKVGIYKISYLNKAKVKTFSTYFILREEGAFLMDFKEQILNSLILKEKSRTLKPLLNVDSIFKTKEDITLEIDTTQFPLEDFPPVFDSFLEIEDLDENEDFRVGIMQSKKFTKQIFAPKKGLKRYRVKIVNKNIKDYSQKDEVSFDLEMGEGVSSIEDFTFEVDNFNNKAISFESLNDFEGYRIVNIYKPKEFDSENYFLILDFDMENPMTLVDALKAEEIKKLSEYTLTHGAIFAKIVDKKSGQIIEIKSISVRSGV